MNLYDLHDNAKDLHRHEDAEFKVPQLKRRYDAMIEDSKKEASEKLKGSK